MKRMIFHIPASLNPNMPSGSQIRPLKMLQAFRDIGYTVDVVMGDTSTRKKQIKAIKSRIRKGEHYSFLYSESSTEPTLLTGKHHLPLHPFLDFSFIRFCKKNKIKTGLFYRDIYWIFDVYKAALPPWKASVAKYFYRYDLRKYSRLLEILYLPSLKMLEYIPMRSFPKAVALPPAMEIRDVVPKTPGKKIAFLYLGGIGEVYDLRLFMETIRKDDESNLIVCTRKSEWEREKKRYASLLAQNIRIEHLAGDALQTLFEETDIAVYFLRPHTLWNFAVGLKLFEYLSYRKPVIAVQGTAVGDFVKKNNVGWAIDYDTQSLTSLIEKLHANPRMIEEKIANIDKIALQNTWQQRAKQVEMDLI